MALSTELTRAVRGGSPGAFPLRYNDGLIVQPPSEKARPCLFGWMSNRVANGPEHLYSLLKLREKLREREYPLSVRIHVRPQHLQSE